MRTACLQPLLKISTLIRALCGSRFLKLLSRDKFISGENALDQGIALFPGNQDRAVNVVDDEDEERKHDAEVKESQVGDVDQARKPANKKR